jgi:hypothetical protein
MPYQTTWIVPGKLLYFRPYGLVNAQEMKLMSEESDRMLLAEGQEQAHLMIDYRDITKMDISFRDVPQLFHRPSPDSPITWVLSISDSVVQKFLDSFINQMMGLRSRQFQTVEPALAFICGQDLAMPPLAEVEAAWHEWWAANVSEPSA